MAARCGRRSTNAVDRLRHGRSGRRRDSSICFGTDGRFAQSCDSDWRARQPVRLPRVRPPAACLAMVDQTRAEHGHVRPRTRTRPKPRRCARPPSQPPKRVSARRRASTRRHARRSSRSSASGSSGRISKPARLNAATNSRWNGRPRPVTRGVLIVDREPSDAPTVRCRQTDPPRLLARGATRESDNHRTTRARPIKTSPDAAPAASPAAEGLQPTNTWNVDGRRATSSAGSALMGSCGPTNLG